MSESTLLPNDDDETLITAFDAVFARCRAEGAHSVANPDFQRFLASTLPFIPQQADAAANVLGCGRLLFQAFAHAPATPTTVRTLPFKINAFTCLETSGTGTFGTVYLAQDDLLHRVVALKLLHPWVVGPDRELLLSEARAAAKLRHPSIVALHGVIESGADQGIVYDYVCGATLREWLRNHTLSPRQVVLIIVQLADALDYAHRLGLIHRDLKPENVMVNLETVSETETDDVQVMLLDFGVALSIQDAGTNQPHSGTPAYMSPEQAAGSPIDRRSDVYTLGVMLLELLTGKRPPPARDESVVGKGVKVLLDNVADDDLRAVCEKSLAWLPEKRIASAGELQTELERWLRGEPILSRKIGWRERAVKWSRRRPNEALLAAGVLLTFLIGFSLVTWKWRDAVVQFGRAETNFTEMKRQRDLAEVNLQEANTQRLLADGYFVDASTAVDTFCVRIGEDVLKHEPGLQPLRRELLASARDYYRKFIAHGRSDVAVRDKLAEALLNLGSIELEIGTVDAALAAFAEARNIYSELAKATNDTRSARRGLATVIGMTAIATRMQNDKAGARRALEDSGQLFEQLVTEQPGNLQAVLDYGKHLNNLSLMELSELRPGPALKLLQEAGRSVRPFLSTAPESLDARYDLGVLLINLGVANDSLGRTPESREQFEEAVKLLDGVVKQDDKQLRFRWRLATACNNLAEISSRMYDNPQAETSFQRALEVGRTLAEENPRIVTFQNDLAGTCLSYGVLLAHQRKWTDALKLLDEAVSIRRRLAESDPKNTRLLVSLAIALRTLAGVHLDHKDDSASVTVSREGVKVWSQLISIAPPLPEWELSRSETLGVLGQGLRGLKEYDEARKVQREARDLAGAMLAKADSSIKARWLVGQATFELARIERDGGSSNEACDLFLVGLTQMYRTVRDAPGRGEVRLELDKGFADAMELLRKEKRLMDVSVQVGEYSKIDSANGLHLVRCAAELAKCLKLLPADASAQPDRQRIATQTMQLLADARALRVDNFQTFLKSGLFKPLEGNAEFQKLLKAPAP